MLDEVAEMVTRNSAEFQREVEEVFERTRTELHREISQVVTMAYERRKSLIKHRLTTEQPFDDLLQTQVSKDQDRAIFKSKVSKSQDSC
jgi:hypothetical protein